MPNSAPLRSTKVNSPFHIAGLAILFLTASSTQPDLIIRAADVAATYMIDPIAFIETIRCESGFDPSVQSGYLKKDGTQERSYGLAQINLDAHPGITKAQALEPEFALDWMAKQFVAGREDMWSCYTTLRKNGKVK